MRSLLSAPDSRRPRPAKRFCSGISTRSPNDLSRSALSSVGAVVMASISSIDRATPVLGAALRAAEAARPRAVNTSRMPMMKSMVMAQTSTLMIRDIQNAPTARITTEPPSMSQPSGLLEERRDVLVPREEQVDEEQRRQAAEHERGQLALRGEGGDLTAHVLPLADGARHGLEQLGQVATDATLDVDGHHDPGEVLAVEPLGHALERGLEAHAEARLHQHPAELRRDRLAALVDDRVDGLRQGQTSGQRPGHQLERVGQARAELLAASAPLEAEPHPRQDDPAERGT